jgi:heme/copper-type cytochrome/quinol oxidase subunit 4
MSDITLRDDTIPEPAPAPPTPALLPGELHPHPSPLRYVVIAVVLSAVTAAEVSLYYLQGDVPDSLIITLLLAFAVIKFGTVASWYMHLRTDRPIFARFFVLGIVAAVLLYLIVLTSLQIFS